jgi:hypothetical protein
MIKKVFNKSGGHAWQVDYYEPDGRRGLVMAGADLVSVQKQLGHTTIGTTMRYAHLAPGHLKKSSNLISTRPDDGKILGTFGDFPVRQGK